MRFDVFSIIYDVIWDRILLAIRKLGMFLQGVINKGSQLVSCLGFRKEKLDVFFL